MKRITEIATQRLGIPEDQLEPYGRYKAKLSLEYISTLKNKPERQAHPGHRDLADAGG